MSNSSWFERAVSQYRERMDQTFYNIHLLSQGNVLDYTLSNQPSYSSPRSEEPSSSTSSSSGYPAPNTFRRGFEDAMKFVKVAEGGYTHRPPNEDPGGPTMRGITWKTYNAYAKKHGMPLIDINWSREKIKQFMTSTITKELSHAIFADEYWNILGKKLDAIGYFKLSCVVLNISILSGPGRAKELLSKILGSPDKFSSVVEYVRQSQQSDEALASQLIDRFQVFLQGLKNWSSNKNGWTNRQNALRAYLGL